MVAAHVSVPAPPMIRAAVAGRALAAVRERAPDTVEVVELTDDVDLATVSFLVPNGRSVIPRLAQLPEGSAIQTMSAGTDWIEPHIPDQTVLCNARGARDAPVAEWVLAALLGASSGLLQSATQRRWDAQRHLSDLAGTTVLILGMGSIGRQVAAYLQPLSVTVSGVASRARDGLHGIDELPTLLKTADSVVVLAPLSDATRGLLGAAELAVLPDGALIVNAARGPVIDADALLAELRSGRLRAVLDVTDPEPLPDDHPLWTAPGTLAITPHLAGDSPRGHAAAARLAGEQLIRWATGEPLENVVLPVPRV